MSQIHRVKLEKKNAERKALVRALCQGLDISMQRAHVYVDRLLQRFPAFHLGDTVRTMVLGAEGMSIDRLEERPALLVATGEANARIEAAWQRSRAQLEGLADDALEHLTPPAFADDASALEAAIGGSLPEELAAWLAHHDGASGMGPLPWTPLSCLGIVTAKRRFEDQRAVLRGRDEDIEADVGIQKAWWCEGWVPFAENGEGSFLCIDRQPTDEGEEGQVIELSDKSPRRRLVAGSLSGWLEGVADDFKSGDLVVTEERGRFYAVLPRENVRGARAALSIRGESEDQRRSRIQASIVDDPQVLAAELLKGLVRGQLIRLKAGVFPPVVVLPMLCEAISSASEDGARAQAVVEALARCDDVAVLTATESDVLKLVQSLYS